VDQDTVILRDRLPGEGRDHRLDPDTGHREVARDANPTGGRDRLQPLRPLERGHLLSGEQLDAVPAVDGSEYRAEVLAEDPLKGESAGEDGGHVHPELRQRGRHLGADEAHARHYRAPAGHGFGLDRLAFADGPQIVEARQASPGKPEPAVLPARGDQDLLVRQLLARAETYGMRGGIDDRNRGPSQAVHLVLRIPAGRPDVPVREIFLRPQVRLGQRRPAKGDARFPADQGDPVPVTLLPQGYRRVAPGHGAAYDHDSGPAGRLAHVPRLPAPGRIETRSTSTPGIPAPPRHADPTAPPLSAIGGHPEPGPGWPGRLRLTGLIVVLPVRAVRMVMCGGSARTGRIGGHSTARLAVVATAALMTAQLDQGIGGSHPYLRRERGVTGGPVGKEGRRAWMRPRFLIGAPAHDATLRRSRSSLQSGPGTGRSAFGPLGLCGG